MTASDAATSFTAGDCIHNVALPIQWWHFDDMFRKTRWVILIAG